MSVRRRAHPRCFVRSRGPYANITGIVTDLLSFLVFWVQRHPLPVAGAVAAVLALTWLLNRKSKMDRDADRVVKQLVEGSREKYKDVRPLR